MSKIEQEFYKAFDIEEMELKCCSWCSDCPYEEINDCSQCCYWETYEKSYPPISERTINRLEQICGKAVWYMGDCLIFKMDKKTNKSLIFRYKYFAEEYSDRLIAEGNSKKEALLKLASNEYLRTVIYNDVRRLLGIKKRRK